MDYFEGPRRGRRRDVAIGGAVVLLAVFLFLLPASYQAPVRQMIRASVLRPFIAAQAELVSSRSRRMDATELRAARDSLAAVVAAQATLSEENRRLRSILGLRSRAEPHFIPAELIRARVTGAESTFLLDVGSADGVEVGSPVLAAEGLLGVVREVDRSSSHAIDWTHPDFRASAMTGGGDAYGIVEPRRGRFREEDLLALTNAPFHSDIPPGTRIVTSGRGGIYPRGIPLGTVLGIEDADTGWRKSYILRPSVRPEAVMHVLVGVRRDPEAGGDLSELWHVPAAPDTLDAGEPDLDAGRQEQGTR